MKPYCSGSLDDTKLLAEANGQELSLAQMTPVVCPAPIAPLAALKEGAREGALRDAKRALVANRNDCDVLLVEGIGGAAVPLALGYSIGNLVAEFTDHQIIAGSNSLGIINEILLTDHYLRGISKSQSTVVLMDCETPDRSSETNPAILKQVLGHSRVITLPFLKGGLDEIAVIKQHKKKNIKTLAQIGDWVKVWTADRRSGNKLQ